MTQIDAILRAGYLPNRAVEALVDAKLGLIEVTRKLLQALEAEPKE